MVYSAKSIRDGSKVALKVFKRGPTYEGAVQREQYILELFNDHKHNMGKYFILDDGHVNEQRKQSLQGHLLFSRGRRKANISLFILVSVHLLLLMLLLKFFSVMLYGSFVFRGLHCQVMELLDCNIRSVIFRNERQGLSPWATQKFGRDVLT